MAGVRLEVESASGTADVTGHIVLNGIVGVDDELGKGLGKRRTSAPPTCRSGLSLFLSCSR